MIQRLYRCERQNVCWLVTALRRSYLKARRETLVLETNDDDAMLALESNGTRNTKQYAL